MARVIENGGVVEKGPKFYLQVIAERVVAKKALGFPYPPGPVPADWLSIDEDSWKRAKVGDLVQAGKVVKPSIDPFDLGETLEERLLRMQAQIIELQRAVAKLEKK
jgi:hypothetical protein